MSIFLDDDEIAKLTGRKIKSLQIETLRKQGVPFRINATGHPVVARSAIDKPLPVDDAKPAWTPNVLRSA